MARFEQTFCSQCGGEFGPGDSGYSHCQDHLRIVGCDDCGTEGRILIADECWDRAIGGMVPCDRDDGPCPICDGTGGEIIVTWPIEMEDMEDCHMPTKEHILLCDAIALAQAVVDHHENLEDLAPMDDDCGWCTSWHLPHKQSCYFHKAKIFLETHGGERVRVSLPTQIKEDEPDVRGTDQPSW